jgi:tetratricopeptide (TPR) repeat protein
MAAKTNRDFSKRRGKALSNPVSTGGGGSTFEARVQASRLLAMCLGTVFPGVEEGRIVELVFQSGIAGKNTDDLLCNVEDRYGERSCVLLQMKRGIAPQKSNKAFVDALQAAWLDFNRSDFNRGKDAIHIIYGMGDATAMKSPQKLSDWARYTVKSEGFLQKVNEPVYANKGDRTSFDLICSICETMSGQAIDAQGAHEFFKHLQFLASDHDSERGNDSASQLALIQSAVRDVEPQYVWGRLLAACLSANPNAGSFTFDNLHVLIGTDLVRRFAEYRSRQQLQKQPGSWVVGGSVQGDHGQTSGEAQRWMPIVRAAPRTVGDASTRDEVPQARAGSVNKLITGQLDGIHDLLKQARYRDAREAAERLSASLEEFDAHQLARWHQMRGTCVWHLEGGEAAAEDFLRAAGLFQDDDKFLAAGVRGRLLRGDFAGAIAAGEEALERFPGSLSVWLATTNSRIAQGISVTLDDLPPSIRGEADALQMLAWSHGKQGDKKGAARISMEALDAKDANFFTREQALALCLDLVAADGLTATFRMLNANDVAALTRCVQEFSPREARLWKVQSPPVVAAAVDNLAKAMILLGKADDALALIQESKGRGVDHLVVLRAQLEALCEVGRAADAIELGRPHIAQMSLDVVAAYAQIAAETNNLPVVDECLAQLQTRGADAKKLAESLAAMRLTVVASLNGAEALAEIDRIDWPTERRVVLLVACAQVLFNAKRVADARKCSLRALTQLASDASGGERYLVAQALLHTQQPDKAGTILESLVRPGTYSDLHAQLLFCFLRSGRLAKAKQLIDGFPIGWEAHRDARGLAIELAQRAGDWELLRLLVPAELHDAPRLIRSWLFKAMVAAHDTTQAVGMALADAPMDLVGSAQEAAQLARLELVHDQVQQGLRRLYRLRRMNMDSTDVAALHVLVLVTAERRQPQIEAPMAKVGAGTSVFLENAAGQELVFTLDPADLAGLPNTAEFLRSGTPEEAAILGKGIGEEVRVGHGADEQTIFRVKRICSAHLRLYELSRHAVGASVAPSPIAQVISVEGSAPSAGSVNLMVQQIRAANAFATSSLSTYEEIPLTLGGLAKRLARDVIDVICGWPPNGPSMKVSDGASARKSSIQHLRSHGGAYVVDAAALVELANLECLHMLQILPELLITAHSLELLQDKVNGLIPDGKLGTAYEIDGRLAISQVSPEQAARERRLLQRALDAAKAMCTVIPVYGTDESVQEVIKLGTIISDEELAVVRAALERRATLLALDSRLRGWAARLGVVGVCIPSILHFARETGRLNQRSFSISTMRMLCSNRSFVPVTALDLLLHAHQGTEWLKIGLEGFVRQILLPQTNLDSAVNVAAEYVHATVAAGPCHVGAILRVVEVLAEAFFRRSDAHSDLEEQLAQNFKIGSEVVAESEKYTELILSAVRNGRFAARMGERGELKDVRVLFCSSPPWLAFVQEGPNRNERNGGPQSVPMSPPTVPAAIPNGQQHTTEYDGTPHAIE